MADLDLLEREWAMQDGPFVVVSKPTCAALLAAAREGERLREELRWARLCLLGDCSHVSLSECCDIARAALAGKGGGNG